MIVVDSSVLLLLLDPSAGVPTGRDGNPIPRARERIDFLIEELSRARVKVGIPTPVLAEVLVRRTPDEAQHIVNAINRNAAFAVESFDQRAAIELAAIMREELGPRVRPREGAETWAKLKFDRQIVAIAKVVGASTIYTTDEGVRSLAERSDISVRHVDELSLPPDDGQTSLLTELDGPDDVTGPPSEETEGDVEAAGGDDPATD